MPEWVTELLTEYGIPGAVIAALIYLIRFGFIKFESIVKTFSNDFKHLQKEHREDRKEWHEAAERKAEFDKLCQDRRDESQERRDAALTSSLDSLKSAFQESGIKRRSTD